MIKSLKIRCLASYIAIFMVYALLIQSVFMPENAYAAKNTVNENCLAGKSFIQSVDNNIYLTMFLNSVYSSVYDSLADGFVGDFDVAVFKDLSGNFNVTAVSADQKTVTISFTEQSNLKESSYVFDKTAFLKSNDINELLEESSSLSVVKTSGDDKTVTIEKTQSKKTFFSSFVLRMNKFFLMVALLLLVNISPLYAQDPATGALPDHVLIEQDFGTEIKGVLYDLGAGLYLEQNEKYQDYPGFYDSQRKAARQYAQNSEAYTLAGINYDIHATIYRPLTLIDGTSSSFYSEVHRVAKAYNISPYLLFMHAVTERMDLNAYEGEFDRLSSTASKGSFQISPVSLMNYVKGIYELEQSEREREFPFTRNYESFKAFEKAFEPNDVLALDNDDNYNPLEIELAASFLKMHFKTMQNLFPDDFADDFLQQPIPLTDLSQTSRHRNLITLWSISYTANIHNINARDMFGVFDEMHDRDLGVYAWTRMSWRVLNYVENIDTLQGYEGFNYNSFGEISQAETKQAVMAEHNLSVFLYYGRQILLAFFRMITTIPGFLGLMTFVGLVVLAYKKTKNLRRKIKTKRHAYQAKINQRPSVKYVKKVSNRVGNKLQNKFMDFADRVFDDTPDRNKRKTSTTYTNASIKQQKIAKRKHGQRIKLQKGQMGVLYNSLEEKDLDAFVLEQQTKDESLYQFLLRLSDNYIATMVSKYPALGTDDFTFNDIVKGIKIRLRDLEGTEGVKKVQEIKNFIDNNNLYVPVNSVLEFFERDETYSKISDPFYDDTIKRVKQAA